MVGKPQKDQDQESVELLAQLMEKLGCSDDTELATKLSEHLRDDENPIDRTQFPKWRTNGIPKNVKGIIQTFLNFDKSA